ncbi:MAG: DEAD/DEAH box helicase [bacterium]
MAEITSKITLRDYQREALNSVISEYKNGINRQLIVIPTAGGKTLVMAAIAKHFKKRVLILAHLEELIQQAEDKFRLFWPEVDIGIYKAERKELDHQIIIATVQTCSRPGNLKQLKKNDFDILMIDETHHAPAKSYQRIIKDLGFLDNPEKLLIGVTATPMRSDKKELGQIFSKLVYSITIGELIKAGYLSDVVGRRVLTSFNLSNVPSDKGDFVARELATVVNTKDRNKFIVNKFKEYAANRKAIAFCVNVKHCHDLAEGFNSQGIKAEAVWGEMDKEQRKKVLSDFAEGKIQVVTSCGVLAEGFDEPSITAIAMARPTKSKGLYTQMVGRGLRIYPEKENCLVLDFTDRYHNMRSIVSLNQVIPEAKIIGDKEDQSSGQQNKKRISRIKTLKDVDHEFDVRGIATDFFWADIGDDEISLVDDFGVEIVIKPHEKGFVVTTYDINVEIYAFLTQTPLFNCIKLCEKYAHENLSMNFTDLNGSWTQSALNKPPSQKQTNILKMHNADKNITNMLEASHKIQTIFAIERKKSRNKANTTKIISTTGSY